MQYCPAPGIPSSTQQRPAPYGPRTSYPTANNRQHPPGIIQFGGVTLVDDWFQVQPNRRHVQQGQYPGPQALHPGVQHAPRPQHPQAPAPFSGAYPPAPPPTPQNPPPPPPPYPRVQVHPFPHHPSQLATSHPHPVGPSQPQYQPIRPIARLANEYRVATRRHAANGQWPPVTHNRADQFRPTGPPNGINQTQGNEQALCRTAHPGGRFQGPRNAMPSAPQPSFPNPPEALGNAPSHPPGLPIPPAILQKPILPPRFAVQQSSVQGYDSGRQIIPAGNDEVYRPPLPPTPNVYDFPTPRGPMAPRVDNDRTPRAVVRSKENDSSSEARTNTTDTESVVSRFSNSIESGHATTCTSVTSGSERCTSPPPPPATVIVQRSRTAEDKDTLDDELQGIVTGYANKYKQKGLDALLNDLIQDGTQDYRRSLWTAKAARLVFDQLGKDGIPHERLQPALRSEVLRKFRTYWDAAGEWNRADYEQFAQDPYSALPGVNIAGFIGSLFRTSILSAEEVHVCLGVLTMNPLQLHSTCAMHALVVHCDGRLCADEHWPGTDLFCTTLKALIQPVDEVNWDSDDTALVLVSDILGVIDRWRATVEMQTIRDAVDPVKVDGSTK